MAKKRSLTEEGTIFFPDFIPVRLIMIGFGDDDNPFHESVDMMEDLLCDFIHDWCFKAASIATTAKVKTSDFLHVIRKDHKKYARAKELLMLDKDLKQARATFDLEEFSATTANPEV